MISAMRPSQPSLARHRADTTYAIRLLLSLTARARAHYARRADMPAAHPATRRDFVRSIERGLAVIARSGTRRRADGRRGRAAIGVTRASARRTLLTLEQLGYLRCDGRRFTLTPKLLDLGHGYRSGLALPDVARPHLQQLMEATDEFCSVSVLDGDETLCVARVAPARIMNVAMPVGTRLPAYATCVGPRPARRPGPRPARRLPGPRRAARADAGHPRHRARAARRARPRAPPALRGRRPGARARPALGRRADPRHRGPRHRGRQCRRARRPRHGGHAAPRAAAAAARDGGVDRARPRRAPSP